MSSAPDLSFTKLGELNYKTWSGDMQGKLMEKGVWSQARSPSPLLLSMSMLSL